MIEEDDANDYVYKKGVVQELRAYAEQDGKSVIVYNFDEMGGCLVINLNNNKSCTISSNDLVYKKNEKNVYKAFALAESTIGGVEVVKAENPDAAGVIEGGKQIKFGYVGLINTARHGYRGLYYQGTYSLYSNSILLLHRRSSRQKNSAFAFYGKLKPPVSPDFKAFRKFC